MLMDSLQGFTVMLLDVFVNIFDAVVDIDDVDDVGGGTAVAGPLNFVLGTFVPVCPF